MLSATVKDKNLILLLRVLKLDCICSSNMHRLYVLVATNRTRDPW